MLTLLLLSINKNIYLLELKMNTINEEFNIPYYIFEEITEYIELTAKGHCKCMKWENIKSLLNLAVVNKRLSRRQAEFLEKEVCREKI